MNWLLIKSDSQIKASIPSLSEMILMKNRISPDIINGEKEINAALMKEYCTLFFKATHVIISDEYFAVTHTVSETQLEKQNLLMGILLGRNIPIFSVAKNSDSFKCSSVHQFNTEEEMAVSLNESYKGLVNDEMRVSSLNQLMCEGIPFTPASFAAYIAKGKLDICKLFLNAGMSVNTRDETGTPMLNIATRTEQKDIVQWLLEKGADINAISQDRGYSAVMDAVWKKNPDLIDMLIKHGADLSFVSKEGQSILVLAVGIGNSAICKLLADHGADPDIRDSMGMSAYEYASLFKKEEIVSALQRYHKE